MVNNIDESKWQKASASLYASSKIYGFRVDCLHTDIHKFMDGLTRSDLNIRAEIEKDSDEKISQNKNNLKFSTINYV